jgi:hypothetical protein
MSFLMLSGSFAAGSGYAGLLIPAVIESGFIASLSAAN